jgi:succinoglycan biosynthesis protein ExoM
MKIAIAVCTFRRPVGLSRLFDALDVLVVPSDVEPFVVIVDNEGSLATPASPQGWPLVLEVEPVRGIPYARNRAVELCRRMNVDAVVFFDDDEQPHPDCLVRLVEMWNQSGASVVQGGSRPVFAATPAAWVTRGRYFDRSFDVDGAQIPPFRARTSNVLIRMDVFNVIDPPFDTRLGLSGGSDTFLFRTAAEAGHTFVAAASALVDEDVPASRTTLRWLVRRQYRTGWGRSFHLRSSGPSLARRTKRAGAGLKAIVIEPVRAVRYIRTPRLAVAEAARGVAYGLGLVVGMMGPVPSEYSEVHGA